MEYFDSSIAFRETIHQTWCDD